VKIENIEGTERATCTQCRRILYENPIPSVAVLAANAEGRVLMVKRRVEPGYGKWSLAGGFIEMGETAQQAVIRELYEETGLIGEHPGIFDVGTHLNGYYGDVLILAFEVTLRPGEISAGDDVQEAGFFSPAERPELVFRVHEDFLRRWEIEKGLQPASGSESAEARI